MIYPRFTRLKAGEHYEYHLPGKHPFLTKSLYDRMPHTYPFHLDEEDYDSLAIFLWENGITNSVSRENTFLYFLILNQLAADNNCYLVYDCPFNSQELIHHVQENTGSQLCQWRFSIEFMEDQTYCTSFGFVNSQEFMKLAHNREVTNRQFYFSKLNKSNLRKYMKMYSSDITNWFFIFSPGAAESHIEFLLCKESVRPGLSQMLELTDCIVNIQVGGDEGYKEYVLVQSKQDIERKIAATEEIMKKFGEEYESLLEDIEAMDDGWKVDFFKERFEEVLKTCI